MFMISKYHPTNDMDISIIKFYGLNLWILLSLWTNNIADNPLEKPGIHRDTTRCVLLLLLRGVFKNVVVITIKGKVDIF